MSQKVTVQVGVQDNASAPLAGLATKFDTLQKQVSAGSPAVNRLNGSLQQLAVQSAGAGGAMGGLVQSLLAFGPGGIVAGAAVAGLGLIIGKINELREAERKQAEERDQRRIGAMEAGVARDDARLGIRAGSRAVALEQAEAENRVLTEMIRLRQQEVATLDTRITRYKQMAAGGSALYKGLLQEAEASRELLMIGETDAEGKVVRVGLTELERRQAEANLTLQTARVASLAEERKNILEYNQLVGETTERNRRLVVVNSELQRIANTASFSDELRLAALRSLNSEKKKEEKVNKEAVVTDEQRYKALVALDNAGRLSLQQQAEMLGLERGFLAILTDNTRSYVERAAALAALQTYYDRIKKQEEEQIARTKRMEDSLASFNIALETRQNRMTDSGMSILGGDPSRQDVRGQLESRLADLRTQVGETSNIIEQSGLLDQIGRLEDSLLGDTENILNPMYAQFEAFRTFSDLATQSYNTLFDTIAQGGGTLTKFGQGMLRMFAQLARGKAVENIAYGVENLAKAFGFTAVGNLPSAAAAKTASANHFKAAALWGAVGLGAGAASAANSGQIGGGGGVGNNDIDVLRGSATVIINGGFLDMSDPRQAREFQRAIQELTGRRVTITGR